MTSSEVQSLVWAEIDESLTETNAHGVDLRSCLVKPKRIQVIWRKVRDGKMTEETHEVWLVLEERPLTKDGYMIVFNESRKVFGLVSPGFPSDPHPCLDGYYGNFRATFAGM